MSRTLRKLWSDDAGALLATELLFMTTTLVVGLVSGMVALRQAVLSELFETANAVMALDQSFSFSGQSNAMASTAGSSAIDQTNTITLSSVPAVATQISQAACD